MLEDFERFPISIWGKRKQYGIVFHESHVFFITELFQKKFYIMRCKKVPMEGFFNNVITFFRLEIKVVFLSWQGNVLIMNLVIAKWNKSFILFVIIDNFWKNLSVYFLFKKKENRIKTFNFFLQDICFGMLHNFVFEKRSLYIQAFLVIFLLMHIDEISYWHFDTAFQIKLYANKNILEISTY